MNRFAALMAATLLASLVALGAEPTTALPHTHADWASAENDLGEVDPRLKLTNLTIVLNRPTERQSAFDTLLRQQQDPDSPNFHRWLTPEEIGRQFGPPDEDIAAVSSWLQSQGLQVDSVASSRVRIEFSGPAANVGAAFKASLHKFLVDGEQRIAPSGTPQIPISLAALVHSVHGLQTVHERPYHRSAVSEIVVTAASEQHKVTSCSGGVCNHYIAPADFASIYDVNPVYQQAINGAGQTIAIVGRARVYLPDIQNFQRLTSLATKDPVTIVPPNGIDPGPPASTNDGTKYPEQMEATLDVTRAGSVAPGATIALVVSANSSSTSGFAIASQYVVNSNLAQIISLSFGACEQSAGLAGVSFWDSLFSQAAAQGISVFVASGDSGAAGCDKYFAAPPVSQVASPNYICSSSYATCVGGTQFADTANPSAFWSTSSSAGFGSALGYIPEGAWNEPLNSAGGLQAAASGGGVSIYVPTPSWQVGPGVPGVQGRYSPDVSFSAAAHDGYFNCFAASAGSCIADSTGAFRFSVLDGTSAAAPSMAGIAALLNQKMSAAQGHLNPRLYALASNPGNGVFHDITVATSGVGACDPSLPSMCNNSTGGPTDLTGGLAGYTVGPGYDLVTGLGSIDVAKLVANWSAAATSPGQLQLPSPVTFSNQAVGTKSASVTLTITNIGGTPVTISNVTASDNTDFPASTACFTTLQPGGQCTITLSFAPSSVGPHSDILTFTSNGVGSPQSFTASGVGFAATSVSYEGLWLNGNESGWGLNLTHQGTILFGTWFTYDNDGSGMWLVASNVAQTSTGNFTGALYRTVGPGFSATPFSSITFPANYTEVGTLTLSFTDANTGLMSYTVNGVAQSKVITRFVYAVGGTNCTLGGSAGVSPNYQDLWLRSPLGTEGGWGVNITHQGDILFATWFTYLPGSGQANKGMWLVMSNGNKTAPGVYSGALQTTTGPAFSAVPFNPNIVTRTTVGSATFTFTDANNGTFSYTVNGLTQSKPIARYIYSSPTTVCQ